jgi:hypothetical protein
MRSISILALALPLLPTTLALQSILLGGRAFPCDGDSQTWYAWFSDAATCSSGTDIGPRGFGFPSICSYEVTILGHSNITFTGCDPAEQGNGEPTGVDDGGAPALTCEVVDVVGTTCPSANPCGAGGVENTDFVEEFFVCS